MLRALDVVEVAAARFCHAADQVLVEVQPHAEGAGADAPQSQLAHVLKDLGVVGQAHVGQAVGQQHHPAQAAFRAVADRLGAGHPAPEEVCRTTGVECVERGGELRALTTIDRPGCDRAGNLVVVGDESAAVGLAQ